MSEWRGGKGLSGGGYHNLLCSIYTAYMKVPPRFHHDHFVSSPQQLLRHQTYVYPCSASISGDAHLEWRTDTRSIPFQYSGEFANASELSPTVLDRLCRESVAGEVFSIHFKSSNLTDDEGALYLSEEIALVICNGHLSEAATRYTCYSSDHSAMGPTFTAIAADTDNNQAVVVASSIAVAIVVLLITLALMLVCVYQYYSRLKAEPQRMCPIDPHSSVTASLIAASLTPYSFETNDSSHLEFPRENLVFVKVLGKRVSM